MQQLTDIQLFDTIDKVKTKVLSNLANTIKAKLMKCLQRELARDHIKNIDINTDKRYDINLSKAVLIDQSLPKEMIDKFIITCRQNMVALILSSKENDIARFNMEMKVETLFTQVLEET